MTKLWNDLQYQPVLVATVVSTGATGLAAATDNVVVGLLCTTLVAMAGGVTRHYTNSRKHVKDLGLDESNRRVRDL